MSRTTELAICFADVCDSTAIFEEYGDDRSREIVGKVLRLLGDVIEDHDGTVVKTIGDEVMGTFPEIDAATQAVMQFPDTVKQDDTLAALGLQIRVGLCHGSVVQEEDGDVFGDAVNVASRLVDWARADQIVTTAQTLESLSAPLQGRTRNLGTTTFRGKKEPVEIVELLDEKDGAGLTVAVGHQYSESPQEQRSTLSLLYEGKTTTVEEGPLTLGRGSACDLQVSDSRVSRTHAVIERKDSSFVITDTSTNGTYVQIGDEDVVFLHHDELRLHGSGQISLGRPLYADDAHPLRFERKAGSSEAHPS